ncbi:cell division protein FtsL [Kordiimonas aquimaris]|uniref:cell division protein FtsL n=1 Tax=Kordiimonas aquimaris TaxID=707591 RepID=UPI0021CEA1B0|nr:hypothetical protein [Kordiimonas aquimaris]
MRKAFTAFAAVSAMISGAAVMQLKLAVQEQADEVEVLAQQIHNDRENIRVLNAEWAYLTSPHALQEKSISFLALMPPAPKQILGSLDDIPFRIKGDAVDGDASVLLPSAMTKKKNAPKQKASKNKERAL